MQTFIITQPMLIFELFVLLHFICFHFLPSDHLVFHLLRNLITGTDPAWVPSKKGLAVLSSHLWDGNALLLDFTQIHDDKIAVKNGWKASSWSAGHKELKYSLIVQTLHSSPQLRQSIPKPVQSVVSKQDSTLAEWIMNAFIPWHGFKVEEEFPFGKFQVVYALRCLP